MNDQYTGSLSLSGIEGINPDAGVTNCGSVNGFEETLKVFYDTALSRADEIERLRSEGNIRDYTVKVHALKSSARLVGALSLSEEALYLEQCGKDENTTEIEKKTPALLAHYRALKGRLDHLYEKPDESELPMISENELLDVYHTLRNLAEDFDLDGLDGMVKQLEGYRLPDSHKDKWNKIKECITGADWSALEDIL